MEGFLNSYSKTLEVSRKHTLELFSVKEPVSSLYYTVKQVKSPTQSRLASLKNEIKFLKNSRNAHPNIITLLWTEETNEQVSLVYEHCSDGLLASYKKIEPMNILMQICLGIRVLHRQSLVHKNLTVFSVLVHNNVAKIADFELVESNQELFQEENDDREAIKSTLPEWRAPELEKTGKFTKETDIYNIGLIFYYILLKDTYKGELPRTLNSQLSDIFSLTLSPDPSKRANIDQLIKKIEEKQPRDVLTSAKCACFPGFSFKSRKCTISLVNKALTTDFKSSHRVISRLIEKATANPNKMSKFFAELLKLPDLTNDTLRLKACSLLFLYLRLAPLLVYTQDPGALSVITYFESFTSKSLQRENNDDLPVINHAFCSVIMMKSYIVLENLSYFDGGFNLTHDGQRLLRDGMNEGLYVKVIGYWELLLNLHQLMVASGQKNDMTRAIRVSIGEEEVSIYRMIYDKVERFKNRDVMNNVVLLYCNCVGRAKGLFKQDNIEFPIIQLEQQPLNILDEQIKPRVSYNSQGSQHFSKSAAKIEKFSAINLEAAEEKNLHSNIYRPPTIYETAKKNFSSFKSLNSLPEHNNDSIEILSVKLASKIDNLSISATDLNIIKKIGSGSSCDVYLGLYKKKQVAVKQQKSSEKHAFKEFYRELTVLVNLRHPNLVMLIGIIPEHPLSIITEYCAGGDLFTLLHKQRSVFITWQQRLMILKEIAKGMIFLHSNSFVHRDLKSLNILLAKEVHREEDVIQVKISDFGLSRVLSEQNFMTGQLGTCHWMAPEVLGSSNYSNKADVYSFAILMYEVITREVPYKGKTQEEIRTQVIHNGLRPEIKLVPPACPNSLRALMVLCWDENSERRPDFVRIFDILNSVKVQK